MAMVFMDANRPDNPIIFANDSFLELTGYQRDQVLGEPFNFLMPQPADIGALAKINSEFDGRSSGGSEIRCRRKDGTDFWAALVVSPVRDENDHIVQYFASFVDLTRHREREVQSKMLIDELNHRVKNTLATVQAIVSQALRASSDRVVVQKAIDTRLSALARSHDLLMRENWDSAGLADIVLFALEPFIAGSLKERCLIDGENVRFPPKSVLALGIAFNELATNAVKYRALSNDRGSVRISWSVVESPDHGQRLVLSWSEKDGPTVGMPERKGFGTRVLEQGLTYELGGEVRLRYRPTGLVCTIDVPAPELAKP